MSKTDRFIFWALHIVAWMIFIGLCIEAGGLLVNFFFSLFEPRLIQNLYQKLDLTPLYERRPSAFFIIYVLILAISILKAYLFYIVISLQYKMDLTKPFNYFVAKQITKMSYYALGIGLMSYIAGTSAAYLTEGIILTDDLSHFWQGSSGFILMGAVIYIIATIFRTGVHLQNEHDLTV